MEGSVSAERLCVMCSSKNERADVVCTKCKHAYYCSVRCRNRDWDGNIPGQRGWHSLICHLLKKKEGQEKLSGHIADTVVHALKEAAELIMDQLRVLRREFCTAHPKEKPVLFLTFEYTIEEILNATALVVSLKMWIESLVIKETQRALKAQGRALVSDEAEQFLSGAFVNPRLSMKITDEASTNTPPLSKGSSFYSAWNDNGNLACVTRASLAGGAGAFVNRSILVVKDLVDVKPPPPSPLPSPPQQAPASKLPPSQTETNPSPQRRMKVGLLISVSGIVTQTPPLDEEQEGSFAHYMKVEEISGVAIAGIDGQYLAAFFDANWEIKKLPLNGIASYLGQTVEDNLYGDVLLVDEYNDVLKISDLEAAIKKLTASRKAVRDAAKSRGAPVP